MERSTRPISTKRKAEDTRYGDYVAGDYGGIYKDCLLGIVVSRLAEYENTELTPEEILTLRMCFDKKRASANQVVHGAWIRRDNGEVVCNKCYALIGVCGPKCFANLTDGENYCYSCGAKMDFK